MRDFEGHTPVAMHNATERAVPLTWLIINIQLKLYLIANPKMPLNIRKVRGKDALRVHCNIGVKIVDRVGDLPGYGTIWYEPTGIANILSMSRATKKFRVVFDSEGRNVFRVVFPDRGVRFQLIPNGLYYFESAYRENSVLLLNIILENREAFTRTEYEGSQEARRVMHLLWFPS